MLIGRKKLPKWNADLRVTFLCTLLLFFALLILGFFFVVNFLCSNIASRFVDAFSYNENKKFPYNNINLCWQDLLKCPFCWTYWSCHSCWLELVINSCDVTVSIDLCSTRTWVYNVVHHTKETFYHWPSENTKRSSHYTTILARIYETNFSVSVK